MRIKLTTRVKYAGDIHRVLMDMDWDSETAAAFLNSIPDADAVIVVRCKYCKHSCLVGTGAKKLQICHNPEAPWFDCEGLVEVADDFFCDYGEREDGNG